MSKYKIGKKYRVQCARVKYGDHIVSHPLEKLKVISVPKSGWLPIIGTLHEDNEIIGFTPEHVHLDLRFLRIRRKRNPIEFSLEKIMRYPLVKGKKEVIEFTSRVLTCKREATEFGASVWLVDLEKAYEDKTIDIEGLCPHRNIPLKAGCKRPDGSVICAGHGLQWSAKGRVVHREYVWNGW